MADLPEPTPSATPGDMPGELPTPPLGTLTVGETQLFGVLMAALVIRLGGVVELHGWELEQAARAVVRPSAGVRGGMRLETVMGEWKLPRA